MILTQQYIEHSLDSVFYLYIDQLLSQGDLSQGENKIHEYELGYNTSIPKENIPLHFLPLSYSSNPRLHLHSYPVGVLTHLAFLSQSCCLVAHSLMSRWKKWQCKNGFSRIWTEKVSTASGSIQEFHCFQNYVTTCLRYFWKLRTSIQ